jgi:hypothetical protein
MSSLRNTVFAFMAMLFIDMGAYAESLTFKSSETQTSLLELFSSEGCSSCPPAENWLTGLKASPKLWQDFVPVAFHVDYWDYLGWRDRWASKAFSDRQRAYAQFWGSASIYTPGFVLNGHEWRASSRPKDGPRASGVKAGALRTSSADLQHWQVSFIPATDRAGSFDVFAALLANGLTSEVKAGENQGRRLLHDFVVTSLHKVSLKPNGDGDKGEFKGEVSTEPAKGTPDERLALAVWVTRPSGLEPLQAVGGWLPH